MASIAIGATGLGIAVTGIVIEIKKRIDGYIKAPTTFETLRDKVNSLEKQFDEVDTRLKEFPSALPSEISTNVSETFEAVRKILESSVATMDKSFKRAFAGSNNCLERFKSKALRVCRATKLANELKTVEANIDKASDKLLQLALALGIALNIQDLEGQDAAVSKTLPKPKTYAPPTKLESTVPPPKPPAKPELPPPKPHENATTEAA